MMERPDLHERMDKRTIRKLMRTFKETYGPERLKAFSMAIADKLMADDRLIRARTVLLYHSLPDEVDTHELIERLHATGKCIILPSVVGDDLELYEYEGEESLKEGSYHIMECVSSEPFKSYDSIDLAIIPGVAYDRRGNRVGRGKGYYDRLLPRLSCPKIGLCFLFQLVDQLPTESHDQRVDSVCHG